MPEHGPCGLSHSCGVTGQVNHPAVIKRLEEVLKLSQEANAEIGAFLDDFEDAKK